MDRPCLGGDRVGVCAAEELGFLSSPPPPPLARPASVGRWRGQVLLWEGMVPHCSWNLAWRGCGLDWVFGPAAAPVMRLLPAHTLWAGWGAETHRPGELGPCCSVVSSWGGGMCVSQLRFTRVLGCFFFELRGS